MSLPRITELSDAAGYWTARVSVDGVLFDVSREWGSWMRVFPGGMADLRPSWAADLQDAVRAVERARQKEAA